MSSTPPENSDTSKVEPATIAHQNQHGDIKLSPEAHERMLAGRRAGGAAGFKLTNDALIKITGLVQLGNHLTVAAACVSIGERALYNYIRRGREADEIIIEQLGEQYQPETPDQPNPLQTSALSDNDWMCWKLVHYANEAEAEAEAHAVGLLRKHMADHPTAVIAFLERRAPKRWRRRDQHEVVLPSQGPDAEQGLLEPEATEHVHQALRKAAQAKQLPPPAEPA